MIILLAEGGREGGVLVGQEKERHKVGAIQSSTQQCRTRKCIAVLHVFTLIPAATNELEMHRYK